ncbi:hypothetical protein [Cryobacterium sp. TMT2-15-1]|nr:hypothetical protein [Cryobacterium sp. TMT2-15-1]
MIPVQVIMVPLFDFGASMAFALINVVPMVVLFLVFQRFFVQGFARSGIK